MPALPIRPLERWLGFLLAAAAAAVLALVLVRTWNRPLFPYDCWTYHLPFAARLHGIGGGEATFVLSPGVEKMYRGFPLFAEWLQGALWRVTGELRAAASVNAIGLSALVAYASVAFRLPFAALVFGFLAVPMVAIHAPSGYIDLFVGAAITLQALAALRLLELDEEAPARPPTAARRAAHAAVFLAAAAAAGNSKFMGEALVLVVAAFLFACAWSRRRPRRVRFALAALALAGALAGGATMIRNSIRYAAPFYPMRAAALRFDPVQRPRAGATAAAPADRAGAAEATTARRRRESYLPGHALLSRPLGFLLSATEIDWRIRGVDARYDIDSRAGDDPRRYQPARTGGWWGAYVLGQLALLAAELRRRRRVGWSPRDRRVVALLGATTAAVALLPLSYLLRYWLFWPLLLVVSTALLAVSRRGARPRLLLSAALAAAFAWSYFALPSRADFRPLPARRWDAEVERARLAPALLQAVEEGRRFCLDSEHQPFHFRYSAAILGGNHVVEQTRDGQPCRVYPRLDVPAARGARQVVPQEDGR